jgi:hypothetical protein
MLPTLHRFEAELIRFLDAYGSTDPKKWVSPD